MDPKLAGSLLVVCLLVFAAVGMVCVVLDEAQKPFSEWNEVFDVDCVCGNHLHFEPINLDNYRLVCNKCDKVYED